VSFYKDDRNLYQARALAALPWLDHAFGTAAADPPQAPLTLKQIHSARVLTDEEWQPGLEGDGLLTATAGIFVGVRTADCLPILLADVRHHAVAAIHAGWRGTVEQVARQAVARMKSVYATSPRDLMAAIGPAINGCCFEVGPEVAVQFGKFFPERNDLHSRAHVDLAEANRRQLVAAGVPSDQISSGAPCTFCQAAEFHSWRREKSTARRMISLIGLVPRLPPD
jgi:polyphenol oxidase